MKSWKEILFGFLIGGTMSVPGVSGGTTALALGCYEPILSAAADLRKKQNLLYLFRILLGGIAGFFLIAGILKQCFRILPLTMTMLFCGAAGAGIFLLGKDTVKKGFSLNSFLFFLLGLGTVFAIERLPQGYHASSPLFMLLWGVFLAAGIILPGISTSHLLLIFGLYDKVTGISGMEDVVTLLPLVLGTGFGILLLTKPLAKAMKNYPIYCQSALLGFAAGSMKALITPCLGDPQISYLPLFQIVNGTILAGAAIWGILQINRTEPKVKKL